MPGWPPLSGKETTKTKIMEDIAKAIRELGSNPQNVQQVVSILMQKNISLRPWSELLKEYDVNFHPVMDQAKYPDVANGDGTIDYVTRVPLDLMKVTAKRMTELVCGIPAKRVYKPQNDRQKEAAKVIERIYMRQRIDSVNVERLNMLFAGCEVATLWYSVPAENNDYGIRSSIKVRCRNFSPMLGDQLYPLFDEYGDMVAMSFWYQRVVEGKTKTFFDAYTAENHVRFGLDSGWELLEAEETGIGKIPCIYMYRPTPIWENNAQLVYEMEWALSRNGNYIRKNSKPIMAVYSDEVVQFGDSEKGGTQDKRFKDIFALPTDAKMEFVTWQQAADTLKFHAQELRQQYFSSLQMPDFSMDNMKTVPMSGEARKMVFIDAQMKAKDESGRIQEFLDRETSVVKAFAKAAMNSYDADIDALEVENVITPYTLQDEKETIENLMTATAGKPVLSQREAVQYLGWSDDVDETLRQMQEESAGNAVEPFV